MVVVLLDVLVVDVEDVDVVVDVLHPVPTASAIILVLSYCRFSLHTQINTVTPAAKLTLLNRTFEQLV